MSATKPLCEGIANDRDHFANFFMQDTVHDKLQAIKLNDEHKETFNGHSNESYIHAHKLSKLSPPLHTLTINPVYLTFQIKFFFFKLWPNIIAGLGNSITILCC